MQTFPIEPLLATWSPQGPPTLGTIDEPALTCHYYLWSHSSSHFMLCILWVWMQVQWRVLTIIVPYRVGSLPWISCVLPAHPHLPLTPGNHPSSSCLLSFTFSRSYCCIAAIIQYSDFYAEAKAPILWPPDAKSQPIRKDPDSGKDWIQEEKGMTEDKMDGITNSVDMNLNKLREMVKDREACSPWDHRVRHDWVTEQQAFSDWLLSLSNAHLSFFYIFSW